MTIRSRTHRPNAGAGNSGARRRLKRAPTDVTRSPRPVVTVGWPRGTENRLIEPLTGETDHLRVLIANERKDRLALVATIVAGLGHNVIAREIDVEDVGAVTARRTRADPWRAAGSRSWTAVRSQRGATGRPAILRAAGWSGCEEAPGWHASPSRSGSRYRRSRPRSTPFRRPQSCAPVRSVRQSYPVAARSANLRGTDGPTSSNSTAL
jgi:hypothetical protein